MPYVINAREQLCLPTDQKALIIFDVFTGQMTSEFNVVVESNNLVSANVPGNMTKYYQTLDLTVNKYAKTFTKRKFNEWYANEISSQLDAGVALESVDVKMKLSIMKPIHAGWLVQLYNQMTSEDGKRVIMSGWRATGIADAVQLGTKNLPCIDPFNDIDPMLTAHTTEATNLEAMCNITEAERAIGNMRIDEDNDSEDEWEKDGDDVDKSQRVLAFDDETNL